MDEMGLGDLFRVLFIAAVIGLIIYLRIKKQKFWKEKGVAATAHVVKIQKSGRMVGNEIVWDVHLDVDQPGKPLRRLYVDHRFEWGFAPPEAGDVLAILIHPNKPDKILISLRPGT